MTSKTTNKFSPEVRGRAGARGFELSDEETRDPGSTEPTPSKRQFVAKRSGLPPRTERQCLKVMRAAWPNPDSTPLALRHCGVSVVTAPDAVATGRDPTNVAP